jgi:hypothetical protein
MDKEFTPYTESLSLKELEFDEPCFAIYGKSEGDLFKVHTDKFDTVNELHFIKAPTFSQAFRFFREKYLLFGYPFPNDYQNYGYRIVEMTSDENKELVYDWGTKDSVEEAELECLKKLIEIVKEK